MSNSGDSAGGGRFWEFASSRAAMVSSLGLLFFVNLQWYAGSSFRALMGDDLLSWYELTGYRSIWGAFMDTAGGKFRPVFSVVQYVLFRVFSTNYHSFIVFHLLLNYVIAAILFLLARKLARGDSAVALFVAIIFLTSRFAPYNVLVVIGALEGLSLLFFVLILVFVVDYLTRPRLAAALCLVGLYGLIILTHERYLALLPFLALVLLFGDQLAMSRRAMSVMVLTLPVVGLALAKRQLGLTFFLGSNNKAVVPDLAKILGFFKASALNTFWVNTGPDYLVGAPFDQLDRVAALEVRLLVALLVVGTLMVLLRAARMDDPAKRRWEIRSALLLSVLISSLWAVASISVFQELRWFLAPFVALLLYFASQYSTVPAMPAVKYGILLALCFLIVSVDSSYESARGKIYWYYSGQIADSIFDQTVGKYGNDISTRTLYIEQDPELDWPLLGDGGRFFAPYFGRDHVPRTVFVGSFGGMNLATVDRQRSLFYKLDLPTRTFVNVTNEVLASQPASSAP